MVRIRVLKKKGDGPMLNEVILGRWGLFFGLERFEVWQEAPE